MEVVWSAFNILATIITDILYDKALVNNLFSFDLDKKIIELKKNKNKKQNDNIKLDDAPKIYSQKTKIENEFSGPNSKQDNNELKNNLNEEDVKNIAINNEFL